MRELLSRPRRLAEISASVFGLLATGAFVASLLPGGSPVVAHVSAAVAIAAVLAQVWFVWHEEVT